MSQDWRPPGDGPAPAAPPAYPAATAPPAPPAPPVPTSGGGWAAPPSGPSLDKATGTTQGAGHGYGYGYGYGGTPPVAVPLAPRPGVVPLRPLGLGEIYDGAFQAMRRNPAAMVGSAAIVSAVTTVAATALQGLLGSQIALLEDPAAASAASEEELATFFGLFGLGWIVTMLLTVVCLALLNGVLVVPVSRAVTGHRTSFGEAWRAVWPRFWALLGLVGLALAAGFVLALLVILPAFLAILTPWLLLVYLLVLPAALLGYLWLLVRTTLATPAVMLEGVGPVRAFGRVQTLVGGLWTGPFWRSVGVLVLALVIVGVAQSILIFPAILVTGGIAFASPDDPLAAAGLAPLQLVVTAVFSTVAAAVVYPFQSGVGALLYVDHRIRREGLDVELARAAEQ